MLSLTREDKKIIEAVRAGGEILKQYYDKNLHVYEKTCPADFYTKADIESEEIIIETLGKHFKRFSVHAEESGRTEDESDYTFIIDPLDGTNNFFLGIPYFSVAVGLKKDKEMAFSVIYNPVVDQMYLAKKGKGAFHNNKKLSVNRHHDMDDTTVVYISGYSNVTKLRPELIKKLNRKRVKRILDNWCPTLDYCLLASGKVECLINNDDDIQESSIGRLLIQEAGGLIVDFHGQDKVKPNYKKFIAANNHETIDQIMPLIKSSVRY